MHVCTSADLGPLFYGWAGVVNGTTIALISVRAQTEPAVADAAAELLQRAGVDCGSCTLSVCPAGLTRGA
jgi:hypothetical protein